MSSTKVKIYKNSERNKNVEHTPYVPQYKVHGIEPNNVKSSTLPNDVVQSSYKGSEINPRASRPVIRHQPYAEAVPSPIGVGKGLIPNVGNNMEQTWSGVDGEIVDDISNIDQNHAMIDNNEFVEIPGSNFSNEVEPSFEYINEDIETETTSAKQYMSENLLLEGLEEDYFSKVIKELDEGEYLLLVNDMSICSGSAKYIEEQTRALVFGEHELFINQNVSIDDIIVIKRIKIKVGVFLD